MTTGTVDLAACIRLISNMMKAPDGLDEARRFTGAVLAHHPDAQGDLLQGLNDTVAPPAGVITVGLGRLVFANPLREGWAWQCGTCRQAWRDGTGRPAAALNYPSEGKARAEADEHAKKHLKTPTSVQEMS